MLGSVLLAGCTSAAERVDTGSEPASSEKSSRSEADEPDGDGLATAEVPVAVMGVGLATVAPARSVDSKGIVQRKQLLISDLDRSSEVRVDVETINNYVQPLAGDGDADSIALLVQTCNAGVFIDRIECPGPAFGVVVAKRSSDSSAEPRELPLGVPTDVYRSVSVASGNVTSLRVSTADALGDGSFPSGTPIPKVRVDVVRSVDGKEFEVVSSRSTNNLEPCLTSDGAAWDVDADGGAIVRLDPASVEWAPVDGISAGPLTSISCGAASVAVLDPASRTVSVVPAREPDRGVKLSTPGSFWPSEQTAIPDVARRVGIDPVTDRPFSVVPVANGETELLVWDADGAPSSSARLAPGVESWLPVAGGAFWRSGSSSTASIERVGDK